MGSGFGLAIRSFTCTVVSNMVTSVSSTPANVTAGGSREPIEVQPVDMRAATIKTEAPTLAFHQQPSRDLGPLPCFSSLTMVPLSVLEF